MKRVIRNRVANGQHIAEIWVSGQNAPNSFKSLKFFSNIQLKFDRNPSRKLESYVFVRKSTSVST